MAVAFACPGCSTPFNVTEEMAGKRAKCPKCLIVFTLPSAEPARTAVAESAAGKSPVPAATTDLFKDSDRYDPDRKRSKRSSRDDDDLDDRDRGRDRDRDRDEPRSRRSKKGRSGGSIVPWVLAVAGVAVVLLLVCSGLVVAIVMVSMDRAPAKAQVGAVAGNKPPGGDQPMAGGPGGPVKLLQGAGTKITLVNGMFNHTDRLTPNDPVDPMEIQCRCKLYQVDLQPGRNYQIDLESNEFDAYLRLEDAAGHELAANDDIQPGVNLNSRIFFTPNRPGPYVVVATTFNQAAFGTFTLRIRENQAGGPNMGPNKGFNKKK